MSPELVRTKQTEVLITHSANRGLLRVTVTGPATIEALAAYAMEHVTVWREARLILWDLRLLKLNQDLKALKNTSVTFRHARESRPGGKTAMVTNWSDLQLGKLVSRYSERQNLHIEHRCFGSIGEAESWLLS